MSNAREILDSENKMLEVLDTITQVFAKSYEDFEAENLKCWGTELDGYREINDKYIKLDDQKLENALNDEIKILEGCLASIPRSNKSDAAEYWKKNLEANIYYTRGLLSRIK